ncbi:MAG: histidinol-phosphate transaminase [Oscillospiraceae bacterium]
MSRFYSQIAGGIAPYVPGEQPRDRRYIKLNTNECPYPPSPAVRQVLREFDSADLRLYPDPDALELRSAMAKLYGLDVKQVFAGGGSDEVLGYCFQAFGNPGDQVCFADITYGFYKVYADLFSQRYVEIPLDGSFRINVEDYLGLDGNLYIANPNAPTGIALSRGEIERILKANSDRLVVVDEAYADFSVYGTCVPLLGQYDNLLVVQTFSKSRSLAGMRLGFAFGSPELMEGLERIKYSFNPYNIDRLSMAVGVASIQDETYFAETVGRVVTTRIRTTEQLERLGMNVLPSSANFLFASLPGVEGSSLYTGLRERGVLVRHFDKGRIADFVRITVGTDAEMDRLVECLEEIKQNKGK